MAVQAQSCSDNFGFPLGCSENLMESAYGFNEFYFSLPQKQQQQLQIPLKTPAAPCLDNTGLLFKPNNHLQSAAFSQIDKLGQGIDRFICLQNEKLRLVLQEQRKQQVGLLLRKYESKAVVLLKQKDDEIAKAMNRKMELEDLLRKMEIESQTWERVAKENEAMIASLNNSIEQLRENACLANAVEDAESCCDRGERDGRAGGGHEERESEEQGSRKLVCKSCDSRSLCVVFLPCRHLCSCKACEAFLDSCPVCGVVRESSIEALI